MKSVPISTVLERIFRFGLLKFFRKGELIVREGQPFQYLYIIIEGSAKVLPSAEDGVETLIEDLYAGDFIGDVEYYGSTLHFQSVKAIEDCEIMMIPISRFNLLLEDNVFVNYYVENLSRKLYLVSTKSKYLNTMPAKERLMNHLRENSVFNIFTIPSTMADLAKYLGMTSRHLRRILNDLKKKNILDVQDNKIILKEGP